MKKGIIAIMYGIIVTQAINQRQYAKISISMA